MSNSTRRHVRSLVILAVAFEGAGSCACAQSLQGSAAWQVSADNGETWQQDVSVGSGQQQVLVRLIATWSGAPAGERTAFASTGFDGIVRGIGAGLNDTVGGFVTSETPQGFPGPSLTWTGMGGPPIGYRQGEILRIDSIFDNAEPGVGPNRVLITQGHPSLNEWLDLANPVRLMQYTLFLDGTVGTREIGSLWSTRTPEGLPRLQVLHDDAITHSWQFAPYNVPLTVSDASITVVPAPGILGLLGVFALPRRRRGTEPSTSTRRPRPPRNTRHSTSSATWWSCPAAIKRMPRTSTTGTTPYTCMHRA